MAFSFVKNCKRLHIRNLGGILNVWLNTYFDRLSRDLLALIFSHSHKASCIRFVVTCQFNRRGRSWDATR